MLRRLRDRGLLEKQGAGSQTHYVLTHPLMPANIATHADASAGGDSPSSMGGLAESPHVLTGLPPELQARIQAAGAKPRQAEVRALVLALCQVRPFTAAELCQALNRRDAKELRRTYLRPMRDQGLLELIYPETEKHPLQAYRAVGSKQDEADHA